MQQLVEEASQLGEAGGLVEASQLGKVGGLVEVEAVPGSVDGHETSHDGRATGPAWDPTMSVWNGGWVLGAICVGWESPVVGLGEGGCVRSVDGVYHYETSGQQVPVPVVGTIGVSITGTVCEEK